MSEAAAGRERRVPAGALPDLMAELKSAGYDYLSSVTGVDYLEAGEFEIVYGLYSTARTLEPVTVRVRIPRSEPRIPSIVSLFRGADFQEREIFDLFGVVFEGHLHLKRILLWDEFEGHPLRKDYVPEDDSRPVAGS